MSQRDLLFHLQGSAIPCVPHLANAVFTRKEELLALLDTRSSYNRAVPVEGIYLRVEEAHPQPDHILSFVVSRAKLVRPDFIQGIEGHWSGRILERNKLRSPAGD